MKRLLLSALNAPFFIFLGVMGIIIQSTVFRIYPISYLKPDLVLLLVLWVAIRRNFFEGGVITLILAHISQITSGALEGYFLVSHMAIYLIVRFLNRIVYFTGVKRQAFFLAFATVAEKIFGALVLRFASDLTLQLLHLLSSLGPAILANILVAGPVFRALEIFDRKTFKDIKSQSQMREEILSMGEGF